MSERIAEHAAAVGVLAEPVRRCLYLYVVREDVPVSREQAATAVGVALHSARFHLDRLVEEGLLEVEFRRPDGRSGPGAGRPTKLYRRSSRELSVSLPERRYDLAGQILAAGVDRAHRDGGEVIDAVRTAATDEGRQVTDDDGRADPDLDRVSRALAARGYEPTVRSDQLVLRNCPFDALARAHTELVCGANEAFVAGALEGLGCGGLQARLEPAPGLCCVRVRPRADVPQAG